MLTVAIRDVNYAPDVPVIHRYVDKTADASGADSGLTVPDS
jgi:hypothetical protein